MNVAAIVLAAGYGTRMKSALPKVMHPIMGRPMVEWSTQAVASVSQLLPTVVVGHGRELLQELLGDRVQYVVQEEMLGTAHAVMQAESTLRGKSDAVTVTYGDMPLLQGTTLKALVEHFEEFSLSSQPNDQAPVIAMLTLERDDPQGFGRIVRDQAGNIQAIVEEVDCSDEQKLIRELNPGVYCFNADWLWENLHKIQVSAKGEYYLTDLVGIAISQGEVVRTVSAPPSDVEGINTRVHLAQATSVMRQRILEEKMLAGVTIIDPSTTYIEDTVSIGQDSVIYPGCVLQGRTVVGVQCTIGPNTQIVDSQIGNNCRVKYSVVGEAQMDDGSEIGPFGHLRSGAHLGENVHMGNFGEVKNSYLAPGTKMGHFSYIGDATVAENVNIGAGTITCNYDGVQKHKTEIGAGAFIGSDTLLVAPVTIGVDARTGAGSVVTRDVPPGTIAYGVPARPARRLTSTDEM